MSIMALDCAGSSIALTAQPLRVVHLLEHEGNVQTRLARKAFAAAIHAMLSHERQRIGEQIEGDGQTSPRRPHHRFVALECVAMFVEYGCFHLRH